MKKSLLLIIILLSTFCVYAQQGKLPKPPAAVKKNKPTMPDENSIVKDSANRVLAYSEWHQRLVSGGYGLIRNSTDPPNQYSLYRLSAKQREENQKRRDAMKAELLQKVAAAPATQPAEVVAADVAPKPIEPPLPRESNFFKNGEKIDPIRVTDMNGQSFNMKKMAGKVIVLNFWFIGCPPCRSEIPELNKLVDEYAKNEDVVFIAIGLDKRYNIKKFTEQIPYKYHIVENGEYFANNYGVNLYPTNVVIDKGGIIKFSSSGFGPAVPYWIKKNIDQSLAAN